MSKIEATAKKIAKTNNTMFFWCIQKQYTSENVYNKCGYT